MPTSPSSSNSIAKADQTAVCGGQRRQVFYLSCSHLNIHTSVTSGASRLSFVIDLARQDLTQRNQNYFAVQGTVGGYTYTDGYHAAAVKMEIAPIDNSNVVKESSSSQQSSVSEFEKDIGGAHVIQKSANFEAEESSKMVSESVSQSVNQSVSQSVVQSSSVITEETKESVETTVEPTLIEDTGPTAQLNGSESIPPAAAEPEKKEDEVESVTELTKSKLTIERQTSTTSLEEQQRESNAEVLLALLEGRGQVGTRPQSLPANLAHLWQSLKISCELNKKLSDLQTLDENNDNQEASGHKVNVDDGLRCKPIDLDKLFTPASDSGEITPSGRRKMFSSSSFYGAFHPTVEDQVDLARRISHSLSDISNRESKGQSMYVNRKKRSVKWVHEGEGKNVSAETENFHPEPQKESKPILKLVMDPRGQVQDLNSLRKQGYTIEPPMSPESCFDIVRDLNAPKGKGAELFAKRRKKSENWIIDENNVKTVESYQATTMSQNSMSKLPPPSYLKNSNNRVENVQKMNEIQERFTLPRIKMIKSPWEAALEGSVESAFQEINSPRGVVMAPTPTTLRKLATPTPPLPAATPTPSGDLCKPKTPRAWNPIPACKTFSSVKLDQIFAGSPKSPVSLAYHPDTNTISTEPVIVENKPAIASQLAGHEVFDEKILHEQKARSLNQFLIYDMVAPPREERPPVSTWVEEVDPEIAERDRLLEEKKKQAEQAKTQKPAEDVRQTSQEQTTVTNETTRPQKSIQPETFEKPLPNAVQPDRTLEVKQTTNSIKNVESMFEQLCISSEKSTVATSKTEMSKSTSQISDSKSIVSREEQNTFSKTASEFTVDKKSILSVDEEVQDLTEREFNELSLEYEKVEKHEIKKPAAIVAGAVPLFDPASDFSAIQRGDPKPEPDKTDEKKEPDFKAPERKQYKKPPSMVPGARPLFGGAIVDLHLEAKDPETDEPYEKIPVKNLINTFEQSTRPPMKYKISPSPSKLHEEKMKEMESRKLFEEVVSMDKSYESHKLSMDSELHIPTVEKRLAEMSEEEIKKIEHHYELEKQKKHIYDEQMQKYKDEMKQLKTTKSNSTTHVQSQTRLNHQYPNFVANERDDLPKSQPVAPAPAPAPSSELTSPYLGESTHLTPIPPVQADFTPSNNFNTAPRGWQSSMSYYRPVTFTTANAAYTDF